MTRTRLRWNVLGVLGKFGPDAKAAKPAVAKLLADDDVSVGISAETGDGQDRSKDEGGSTCDQGYP